MKDDGCGSRILHALDVVGVLCQGRGRRHDRRVQMKAQIIRCRIHLLLSGTTIGEILPPWIPWSPVRAKIIQRCFFVDLCRLQILRCNRLLQTQLFVALKFGLTSDVDQVFSFIRIGIQRTKPPSRTIRAQESGAWESGKTCSYSFQH